MKRAKQEKRPSSDNFVDVHMFVVPHELWMEKYRTTYNNSTLESISIGFVRVPPVLSLIDLRIQIKEQLGGGDVIPEEYVFLRCVGRCLAIVSKAQEFSLKVKHFIPPIVSSPEIFVLFGTHESLSHSLTSSINTGSDLAENISGYLTYSRERDTEEISDCSSQTDGEASRDSSRKDDTFSSARKGRDFVDVGLQRRVHFEKTSEKNDADFICHEDDNHFKIKAKNEGQDDQTQSAYADNSKMVNNATAGNVGQNEDEVHREVQAGKITETYLTDLPQSFTDETLINNSAKNLKEKRKSVETQKNIKSSSRDETVRDNSAGETVRISHDGISGTQKKEDKELSPGTDCNSSVHPRNETRRKNPLIHSKTAPSLLQSLSNEINSGGNAQEYEKRDKTASSINAETTNDDRGRLKPESEQGGNDPSRTISTEKEEDSSENKPIEYSAKPKSTSFANPAVGSNGLQSLQPKDATGNKQDVHHKETHLGVTIADKKNLILQLQAELNTVRAERSNSEKVREQLLKKAKNLQNQNNQRRGQARNIWKKRYFEEKKTTVSLEERCNQLRYEVEVLHKRLLSSMDLKDYEATLGFVRHDGDPDKVNHKILLTRKENEVEELKRRVEEAKIKLGSEMKLRDNAQKELKQIRDEVIDKKINATLVKKSLSLLETRPNNT